MRIAENGLDRDVIGAINIGLRFEQTWKPHGVGLD